MAVEVPDLSGYLPEFKIPSLKPAPKKVVEEPVDYYAQLTPQQKARVDKRVELEMTPRGTFGEIGSQFMGGLTHDLPRMVGQGLKSTGKEGNVLYDAGQGINNFVQGNATRFMADENPEHHNVVTNAIAGGVRGLAPSLAPMAAAFIPGVNVVAGGAALAGGVGAGLFGASKYQDTYEKAKEAGKTDAEAHELGLKTGAVEGLGEGLGAAAGGAFIKGAGAIGGKLLGRSMSVDQALAKVRNPEFLKAFAKQYMKTATVEVGTEMGQNAGTAAIEKEAGIDTADPWDAATAAIGPTLVLTAFLGPLAGASIRGQQNRAQKLLDMVDKLNAPLGEVNNAARELSEVITPMVGKDAATEWRMQALETQNEKNASSIANRAARAEESQDQAVAAQQRAALNEDLTAEVANQHDDLAFREELATPSPGVFRAGTNEAVEQRTSKRLQGLSQFAQDDRPQHYAGAGGGVVEAEMAWTRLLKERDAQATLRGEPRPLALPAPTPEEVAVMPPKERAALERAQVRQDAWVQHQARDLAQRETAVTAQQALLAAAQPLASTPRLPAPPAVASESERFPDLRGWAVNEDRQRVAAKAQDAWEVVQNNPKATQQERKAAEKAVTTTKAALTRANAEQTIDTSVADWKAAATEQGIEVAGLKGQNLARITRALKAVVGKPLPTQIERLKATSEFFGENTPSRDSLSAYITTLEKRNEGTATENQEGTQRQGDAVQVSAEASGVGQVSGQGNAATGGGVRQDAREEVTPAVFKPSPKTGAHSKSDYSFQYLRYNPKDRVTSANNLVWLQSYRDALNDLSGMHASGVEIKGKQNVLRAKNRAVLALKELEETELDGPNIGALTAKRIAELDNALQTRQSMREAASKTSETVKAQIRNEIAMEGLAKKGQPVNATTVANYQLTSADQKTIAERYGILMENDPRDEFEAAESPAYEFDPRLADVLDTNDSAAVLAYLAQNGPTEWVRYMGNFLRGVIGTTQVEMHATKEAMSVPDKDSSNKAVGVRVVGRYHHGRNVVRIYLGGENAHAVVHEFTHAATVGRIKEGRAAANIAPGKRTAAQRAAYADLLDLYGFFKEMRSRDKTKQYAFTNMEEFVAETFSNEKFQHWLSTQTYDGRTGMQKFFDWLMDALGMRRTPAAVSALNKALSTGFKFFEDSRFGGGGRMSFAYSASEAAQLTNETGAALVSKADQVFQALGKSKNLLEYMRKEILHAATTRHIMEWTKNSKALAGMQRGLQMLDATDKMKEVVLEQKHRDLLMVTKQAELAVAKLNGKERRAALSKMSELALEQSRLNVDLRKNFDQNLKLNKTLDPSLRKYVNDLHARYMQLDPAMRHSIEDAIRAFRKTYVQQTATFLAGRLRSYQKMLGDAGNALADRLDFRDPTLDTGEDFKVDTVRDMFGDINTFNLHTRIREVLAELGKTNPNAVVAEGGTSLGTELAGIAEVYGAQLTNPYQHLGRAGDFFVSFKVADAAQYGAIQQALSNTGKVLGPMLGTNRNVFMRFENKTQADEVTARLRSVTGIEKGSLSKGHIGDRGVAGSVRGIPEFIRAYMRELDNQELGSEVSAEAGRILRKAALELYPDTSAQGALATRNQGGTPGYDADFLRNFAKRAETMSSMLANTYTLPKYDESFNTMRTEVEGLETGEHGVAGRAVLDEMRKRYQNSLTPIDTPVISSARAFGYHMFLAMSPAFALINLLQPYQLTLPYLGGRYGFVQSFKEMQSATAKAASILHQTLKQSVLKGYGAGGVKGALLGTLDLDFVIDKSGLSVGEQKFVHDLMASGQLSKMQSVELGQLASGESGAKATTLKVLSLNGQYSEVINRLTAGIAAYNLAEGKQGVDATAVGIAAVRDTQYDYSDRNTGRAWGRHGVLGKVTPLMTSFQNYAFQTMELGLREIKQVVTGTPQEKKEAFLSLTGMMVTTSLLAGTLGLPFANVVARIVDGMLGDDDDPSDVKSAYRRWLADVFGNEVGEAIARGAPRAWLGFDLSTRAGMQDLLPGSRFLADRRSAKDAISDGALGLLGPAVSAGSSLVLGLGQVMDGRVLDGLITLMPTAVQGPLKAARAEVRGFTNSTGVVLPMEVTPWDTLVQSAGFTPSKKAEQSEVNFAMRQSEAILKRTKARLANAFYRAVESGGDTTEELQAILKFNRKNPQYRIEPQRGLQARAKERAVAGLSDTGIATLPKYLPTLDKYKFANIT